jgi:DDE superfamily endonuclease
MYTIHFSLQYVGKYFLADAGFFMRPGFLLPYRDMCYHRKDVSQSNPLANATELFNLRHSSLRSTIECTFGILKQRF